MLGFIFNKIKNKKWMVISLLIGNLLMVAIAAANPLYSDAALQRTLVQDFNTYMTENNSYPATVLVRSRYTPHTKGGLEKLEHTGEVFGDLIRDLNVPEMIRVVHYSQVNVNAVPDVRIHGTDEKLNIELSAYTDLADHIRILHGELFSEEIVDHTIEVIVNERTYVEQNLTLGSELELIQVKDADGVPYRIRVVGVFDVKDLQDPYWVSSPSKWNHTYLLSESIYRNEIADSESYGFEMTWHAVLDYTQIKAERAEEILKITEDYLSAFGQLNTSSEVIYYRDTLEDFLPKSQKLNTTMMVLQVPIFILLATFIFMVSRQMLEMEQNEIAVFKSRGAAKWQIIGIYLLQSLLIAGTGMIGGIPLGIFVCKVLGASNAFLEFVQRTALQLELSAEMWLYAGVMALFSVCTMVLPVFRFADVTIVAHKRQKTGRTKRPWWQICFLDVILLAVSVYGLYQFHTQEAYLAQMVLDGAGLNPMLYLSSSLFLLGAGLLVLRLLPLLIRLIFMIGKKWWSPAMYTSFLRILRSDGHQGFIVVFLILTVAMGIFNTQTARTINANGEERIRYAIGADVVLKEYWESTVTEDELSTEYLYEEPDFGKYENLDGIANLTKVQVDDEISVSVAGAGMIEDVRLMGIHTKEFGEIAWFKDTLLPTHWYEYLNTMSQNSNAILVSSNFREDYGYRLGDVMNYRNTSGQLMRGVICGFVDHWPAYVPVVTEKKYDDTYVQTEKYLIVAHLAQLQSSWGLKPYEVWIDIEDSTRFLYEYISESGVKLAKFQDASAELVALKNDPVFQGTNGILTIGFIIVLVLCATGFLIYWILSIQSRTLQFGIFRAMGMSKREILSMLVNEQILISGSAVLAGVLVGEVGADLFVPLIQVAYSSADKVIPLEIISVTGDYLRLGIVIGLMMVVCMVVLGTLISKIKITQALKLGED